MRTVTYESVLHGVAATAGIDPANVLAHEKTLLCEYINTAVKLCWDYYPWQEFTITEERYFRDEWNASSVYSQGDEVYYNNKYYKVWATLAGNPTAAPDTDITTWYEIGDLSDNPAWSETGLYYVGARVQHEDKNYLCIAIPDGTTSSGVDPVNYEYDGIDTSNTTYFVEIDGLFERYIGYEQTGKSVIGTVLSIHKTDPRYSSSAPLNFREGREGIYIEGHDGVTNKVWLRFREEAPEFLPTATTDSRIPKFLAPAIKAFAYKGWLIGDGQHEKSVVQESMGYDLLVKELDRLDLQQERGQPYRITKEPYRRINAKQQHVTEQTRDQIAALKSAASVSAFKVLLGGIAKNAVVAGVVASSMSASVTCEAYNPVKSAGSWVTGEEPTEGRYLIFPNGYERPDGTGEYFPANTYFQITNVNTNGSPPYDISYTATWVDSGGTTQSQVQMITGTQQHNQRGSFWETYSRNDFGSSSAINVVASAEDIVKEATATCSILTFTGSPFQGVGIGEVGGEESTTHVVTVNPSVMTSFELSDNGIWSSLVVGDRVGWDRQNTGGATMLVNGTQQSVSASILENLIYPKNVGEVTNTYGGSGVVAVTFKYGGSTYVWQSTQGGYVDFYLVTADDTTLLTCSATAVVEGDPTATIPFGISATASGNRETAASVGTVQMSIGFPIFPNGGDIIGQLATKEGIVMGSNAKYPIAVSGYYPLWETLQDAEDYNDARVGDTGWSTNVGSVNVGLVTYYRANVWTLLGNAIYNGNYTGTPDAPPAITVAPVTATESNTLTGIVTSSMSITASVDNPVGWGRAFKVSYGEYTYISYPTISDNNYQASGRDSAALQYPHVARAGNGSGSLMPITLPIASDFNNFLLAGWLDLNGNNWTTQGGITKSTFYDIDSVLNGQNGVDASTPDLVLFEGVGGSQDFSLKLVPTLSGSPRMLMQVEHGGQTLTREMYNTQGYNEMWVNAQPQFFWLSIRQDPNGLNGTSTIKRIRLCIGRTDPPTWQPYHSTFSQNTSNTSYLNTSSYTGLEYNNSNVNLGIAQIGMWETDLTTWLGNGDTTGQQAVYEAAQAENLVKAGIGADWNNLNITQQHPIADPDGYWRFGTELQTYSNGNGSIADVPYVNVTYNSSTDHGYENLGTRA